MKNAIRFLTFNAVVALAAFSTVAQQPTASPAADPAAAQKAACAELYGKWRENYNGDAAKQKVAFSVGKEYMEKCQGDEYMKWVAGWMTKYEAAAGEVALQKNFWDAVKREDWKGVANYGKQWLAKEPENIPVLLNVTIAGGKDATLIGDAGNAARKLIQIAEAGKFNSYTADQWKAINFESRADLVGWLNSVLGAFVFKNSPGEAAVFFTKAVQTDSKFKKDSNLYHSLAVAYQDSEYAPLAKDYEINCANKEMTDECKVKYDKLNLVIDRMIDALARAVSLSTDATKKAEWMTLLEGFYKFRNNNDTKGLNELIAGIQAKPLLLPSMQTTPSTQPEPSATTPTGANTSGATPATGATSSTPAAPADANKPANSSDANPKPKPDAKTAQPNNGVKPSATNKKSTTRTRSNVSKRA